MSIEPEMAQLHKNLVRAAKIVGTWKGTGSVFSSGKKINFKEETSFTHDGRPFLFYNQSTSSGSGKPMHKEVGYLRFPKEDKVELVLAQPSGLASIEEGTIDENGKIEISSTNISRTSSATHPFAVAWKRTWSFNAQGQLTYSFELQSEQHAMEHHLEGVLDKQQTKL